MKSKKLFTLLLMGVTALSATASLQAKEITYKTHKNSCVVKVTKYNNCFPTTNNSSHDCPNGLPDVELPTIPDTDQPATNKPGWLPDISVPSKPDTNKPSKPDTEKPSKPDTNKPSTDTEVSSQTAYENKVLELVNVERAKNGLKPLTMDESVRKVARTKSSDMRQNRYFDHNSPVYGSPFDMLKQWMNSPGHRANILDSSFTHIGVGYDAQGNYWTQMFIGK